jgi:phospho-N-acetylmuramoyl-pentapeptide-transferase
MLGASLFLRPYIDSSALLVGFFAMACGSIGLADDLFKKRNQGSTGLKARHKLAAQVVLGLLLGAAVLWIDPRGEGAGLYVPLLDSRLTLGWLHLPLGVVFLTATTNSVNFTDGLDGLLGGLGAVIFGLTAVVLVMMTDLLPFGPDGLIVVSLVLSGICLGFLPVNRHPAKLFMGDTGSMFLGGALAALFALSGLHLLLLIMGFVFVIETLSVIVQVYWFRRTGKRVFLMTPIHHHFEKKGMSEVSVVRMFWVAGLLSGVLGLLLGPFYWT